MKFLVLAVLQLVVTTTATNSTATVDKSAECIEALNALANEDNALAKMPLMLACSTACAGVDCADCERGHPPCMDESGDKSAECIEAENALANEDNALAKKPLKLACEAACTGEDGATCGFLVNGVSMILFALLAMLK